MSDDELGRLSAVDALRAFRAGELSPVELLDATERRADLIEPSVRAISVRTSERARAAARESERRYATGEGIRPLEGLPVLVKHLDDIAGDPADQASLLLDGRVAETTSTVAQRVLDAGAVVHGRSASPEFGVASFTHSHRYGITRNPWGLDFSPGGSSGGAAAALACGTTTLATGSDSAGSIRMPASLCGVVGYKPPTGHVPNDPRSATPDFLSHGPMARTVRDCALFYAVLSDGPLSWPGGGVRDVRVGVSVDVGGFPVEPAIKTLVEECGRALRPAALMPVEVPWVWSDLLRAAQGYLDRTGGVELAQLAQGREELLCDYTLRQVHNARASRSEDLDACRAFQVRVRPRLHDLFEEIDVLLCPTLGLNGFEAGDGYADHGPVIDGVEVHYPFDTHIPVAFNVFNECAALTVPCGMSPLGLPVGVQVVAPAVRESLVFRVAEAIEATSGAAVGVAVRHVFERLIA